MGTLPARHGVRIFPLEAKDDGVYVTIRLDEDEYERLRTGHVVKEWGTFHEISRGKTLPGEAAVFLESLGKHITSYAQGMSES